MGIEPIFCSHCKWSATFKTIKNFKDILKSFVCRALQVLNEVNKNPFLKSCQHCQPRNIEQWGDICTEFGGQALTND